MSKFTKKLDQARLKFFGSKKIAGKKMKHDGNGNLDDEDEEFNLTNNKIVSLKNLYPLQPAYWAQSQQGAFLNSYGSYLQNQSNWVVGGISGNCTCPLCVGAPTNINQAFQYLTPGTPFVQTTWSNNWASINSFTQSETPNLPRDPNYNNDFGWRCWSWCMLTKKLYSPIQNVLWPQAENHAHKYDESSMVRGVAGIHARFVPENWEALQCPDGMTYNYTNGPLVLASMDAYIEKLYGPNWQHRVEITGLVERFGKYVEGKNGWRSEWAIIRKLYAPTTEIGLDLEKAFPEVEVIYAPPMEHPNPIKFDINPNNH